MGRSLRGVGGMMAWCRLAVLIVVALSPLALTALAPCPAAALDGLETLGEAVARNPDDRDLAWAFARDLADADRSEEAIVALSSLLDRWPDHLDARIRLGALLAGQGRYGEALEHLTRAVHLDPGSGSARLLLGMSLEGLGRFEEADAQWLRAATVEPSLRAESLLLRGVAQIEHGDEQLGTRLLEEVIDVDPLGDLADAARLVLTGSPNARRSRFQLQAYGGMDYDSNVTLDSGSTPGLSTDQADGAGVWGAYASADLITDDDFALGLGARYHERDYIDLNAFDERTVLGFLNARWSPHRRIAVRFVASGSFVMLGGDPYLAVASVRPDLLLWLSESTGVVKLSTNVEGYFYEDDPVFSSLERDGISFGIGLSHLVPVPIVPGASGSYGFEYERVLTRAEPDLLGFVGDYDRHIYAGFVRADTPLVWEIALDAELGAAGELYDNENLVDYLAQLETFGFATRRLRRDVLLEAGVGLSRPIVPHVDLEVRWRYQQRFSNTRIFSYQRNIVGAILRFSVF